MRPTPEEAYDDILQISAQLCQFLLKYRGYLKEDDYDRIWSSRNQFRQWLDCDLPEELPIQIKYSVYEFNHWHEFLLEDLEEAQNHRDKEDIEQFQGMYKQALIDAYIAPWICVGCDARYPTIDDAMHCCDSIDPYYDPPIKVNPPREKPWQEILDSEFIPQPKIYWNIPN